jgi:hypothetical protein
MSGFRYLYETTTRMHEANRHVLQILCARNSRICSPFTLASAFTLVLVVWTIWAGTLSTPCGADERLDLIISLPQHNVLAGLIIFF